MNRYFQFKQFSVKDDKSTMKVGTDAVLLGSWVDVNDNDCVLDIGTGCGIMALMLAQRCNAMIDGIDVDEASIEQAKENIKEAGWSHRIHVITVSLQHYVKVCEKKYNLILSNPPFFHNSLVSPSEKKKLAKHGHHLSFEELIYGASQLLDTEGSFCVILPENTSQRFRESALVSGLYCYRQMLVRPRSDKEVNRRIMIFKKIRSKKLITESLTIMNQNTYTEAYKSLTRDFFLHF